MPTKRKKKILSGISQKKLNSIIEQVKEAAIDRYLGTNEYVDFIDHTADKLNIDWEDLNDDIALHM